VTQLRVFADSEGRLHVELSHPGVARSVRLSAPLLPAVEPEVPKQNQSFLVPVRFRNQLHYVPFASLNCEALWLPGVRQIGALDEDNSRDVLNNLVDILAYD